MLSGRMPKLYCLILLPFLILLLFLVWPKADEPPTEVQKLIIQLKDKDRNVREAAADALMQLGEKAASAVPALTEALKDEDWLVQKRAVQALGTIGDKAASAVPALTEILENSKNWTLRHKVAFTLACIGPKAAPAIPALIKAVREAAEALSEKEEPRAGSPAATNLKYCATIALGRIGKRSVPTLIQALNDKEAGVRASAAVALAIIGPEALEAVDALIAALHDENLYVKLYSIQALGYIGPSAAPAIPALEILSKDESEEIRKAAKQSLTQIKTNTDKPEESGKSKEKK